MGLRKINSLIADDYTNNNHPVSTLSDAAQHSAGKSLFCKLHCSQANHCLQMVDQWSVKMLAFGLARRTLAYKWLAQGLSRSVSAFLRFLREYLDPVVKAYRCAQYVDNIGIAANNATDLTKKIRAILNCIRQASIETGETEKPFWSQTTWIHRKNDFTRRNLATSWEIPQFSRQLRFPKSKKSITALPETRELLQKIFSQIGWKA